MRTLTDGERDVLREQDRDARDAEGAGGPISSTTTEETTMTATVPAFKMATGDTIETVRQCVERMKAARRDELRAEEERRAAQERARKEYEEKRFEDAVFAALDEAGAAWLINFRGKTTDEGTCEGSSLRAVRFDLTPINHQPIRLWLASNSCGWDIASRQTAEQVATWEVECVPPYSYERLADALLRADHGGEPPIPF